MDILYEELTVRRAITVRDVEKTVSVPVNSPLCP